MQRRFVSKIHVNEEILSKKIRKILDRADGYAPNANFYLTDYERVRFANVLRAFMVELEIAVPVNQGKVNEGLPNTERKLK